MGITVHCLLATRERGDTQDKKEFNSAHSDLAWQTNFITMIVDFQINILFKKYFIFRSGGNPSKSYSEANLLNADAFSQHNFDQFRQNPGRRHDPKYRSESDKIIIPRSLATCCDDK